MRKYRATALGVTEKDLIPVIFRLLSSDTPIAKKPLQIARERVCFYDLFMNSRASGSSCYLVRSVIFFDVCVAIDENALKQVCGILRREVIGRCRCAVLQQSLAVCGRHEGDRVTWMPAVRAASH